MNRRSFLRGTATVISVMAIAGRLKLREPEKWVYMESDQGDVRVFQEIGDRYAKALANSMIQTKEITMAEALKGCPEYTHQVYGTQIWWKV